MWGGEGGTYPGAVAPFGSIQLTPETRINDPAGYDFRDTSIFFFCCINHMSGYPGGSSGNIHIMPVREEEEFKTGTYSRSFLHKDERSEPGYYRVLFRDNGTLVELTASERAGMFRFTFPPGVTPQIFTGDMGEIEHISERILRGSGFSSTLVFNKNIIAKKNTEGGFIFTFASNKKKENILILKIGASSIDFTSTLMNLENEADTWDFNKFREKNLNKWKDALSVIEVDDPSEINKTIFYTALYHSLLIPWIISDAKGNYKGADGLIHKTKGQNEYGAFSPWDTFRSLHPLLCLIEPDRQNDMILSMLDVYTQSGRLPKGPMTGNHIIAIITDSYLKGINGFDARLAYQAMKAGISGSGSATMTSYKELGYVPSSFSESVTHTAEYAYNDWVLAQFARTVIGETDDYRYYLQRSFNYRNLFDYRSLFLLPRNGNNFISEPENFGYKEGDKWNYSLFIPHNPRDLINLKGGNEYFTSHLDSALYNEFIVFDNETVFHVPYLFNYARSSCKTQKWVRCIMESHFRNEPGGLPGNDDLGSMSSWYVFSAMGFFPTCPARPVYDIGSPIFNEVKVHLRNGKKLVIRSENCERDNIYIKSMWLNGMEYNKSWISHSDITHGGEISFIMNEVPELSFSPDPDYCPPSETKKEPDFQIIDFNTSKNKVEPDEPFYISFSIRNNGSLGTMVLKLYVNGKEHEKKYILADERSVVKDSIECRLYPAGKNKVRLNDLTEKEIEVRDPMNRPGPKFKILGLKCPSIFRKNEFQKSSYLIQNIGGYRDSSAIMVYIDDSMKFKDFVVLDPGETKKIIHQLKIDNSGLHVLRVGSSFFKFKTYDLNTDASVVDISFCNKIRSDTIPDESGLSNHGYIVRNIDTNQIPGGFFKTDRNSFIEFKNSESLDSFGEKITVMAWINPDEQSRGLTDIITKGDFIVLQARGKTISFFAGGWGRGTCTVMLPENWVNKWHHIAGVSDGNSLKIYIDGKEIGNIYINKPANLSSGGIWTVGRNYEFPGERIFNGLVDHIKIFSEPLTPSEIEKEMKRELPQLVD